VADLRVKGQKEKLVLQQMVLQVIKDPKEIKDLQVLLRIEDLRTILKV
jgi:hypothetical protein